MSDLTVETDEPPEFTTGHMTGEILGVTIEEKDVGGEDDTELADFVSIRVGLDNGYSKVLDYPLSQPATTNNMLGRLLDRFGLLEPGEPADLNALKGEEVEVHVVAAEDREEDTEFADFDRETLEPAS